jgi:hypothetical protein
VTYVTSGGFTINASADGQVDWTAIPYNDPSPS